MRLKLTFFFFIWFCLYGPITIRPSRFIGVQNRGSYHAAAFRYARKINCSQADPKNYLLSFFELTFLEKFSIGLPHGGGGGGNSNPFRNVSISLPNFTPVRPFDKRIIYVWNFTIPRSKTLNDFWQIQA